ncbi:MAG: hypothetical protein M3Z08_21540, partial [Chloroflexota bacterium]|nr:hypothetical protein [Chloroflexota bacterium]
SAAHPKSVPIQERACTVGHIIGINAYRVNRASLKESLVRQGCQLQETPHFLVGLRPVGPIVIAHWFALEAIDGDLGGYFIAELKPCGLLPDPQSFGDVFGAVVGSLTPREPQRAWQLFATNTLARYHHLLSTEQHTPVSSSPVEVFATLYKRVCAWSVGQRLLDAGCSFGFLPLVVGERLPALTTVLGVVRAIAEERLLANVQFAQADLLTDDVRNLGHFDTVVALHVLEHFSEAAMYRVLANLLQATPRRLIIAVPYESGEPEPAYGHEQLFSRAKLEALGNWCLDQPQFSGGRMLYEDCVGGLLLVEAPVIA